MTDSGCLTCSLLTNNTDNSQNDMARSSQQFVRKKETATSNNATNPTPVQTIANNFYINQSISPLNADSLIIPTETLFKYYQNLISTASGTLNVKIDNILPKINIYYGNG